MCCNVIKGGMGTYPYGTPFEAVFNSYLAILLLILSLTKKINYEHGTG